MALSDGLVGYWCPWLGSSGYTLLNRSLMSTHGTLVNMDAGADWVGSTIQGRGGYALDFDNTNDRIDASVLSALDSGDATFAFWYYPFSISGLNTVFNNWSSTVINVGFFCFRNGAAISFQQPVSANRITTGSVLTANRWHHIVCRKQSIVGGLRVFVNGALDSNSATPGGNQASTAIFNLCGNYGGVGAGNCQIAEFAIWNRAIADAEASELFRLGPGWYQPYQRKRYAFVGGVTFNRRRRILCGDYS